MDEKNKITIKMPGNIEMTVEGKEAIDLVVSKILSSLKDVKANAPMMLDEKIEDKITQEPARIETIDDFMRSSISDKIATIIRSFYNEDDWFNSLDVSSLYESILEEPIKQSTVSTYLKRMHEAGLLTRKGSRSQRFYAPTKKLFEMYAKMEFNLEVIKMLKK